MRLRNLDICWVDKTSFFSCLRTACKLVFSASFGFQSDNPTRKVSRLWICLVWQSWFGVQLAHIAWCHRSTGWKRGTTRGWIWLVDKTGFLYCLPSLHQQSLLLAAAAASAEAVSASGAQAAVNGLGSAGSGRGSALFSDQFFLLINPKRNTWQSLRGPSICELPPKNSGSKWLVGRLGEKNKDKQSHGKSCS